MYSILNYMYNSLGWPRLHTKSVQFMDHFLATFATFLNFFLFYMISSYSAKQQVVLAREYTLPCTSVYFRRYIRPGAGEKHFRVMYFRPEARKLFLEIYLQRYIFANSSWNREKQMESCNKSSKICGAFIFLYRNFFWKLKKFIARNYRRQYGFELTSKKHAG